MKLFFYYASHTFVNQLKKLLKTWVLVFILVCGLIGGLIGYVAGSLIEGNEEETSTVIEEEDGEETAAEEAEMPDIPTETEKPVDPAAQKDILELAAGVVILFVLCLELMGADKSGAKIFLPADVNILFPSPMKPQSVLLFRLVTRLGSALLFSIYLLFELPVFVKDMGLSAWTLPALFLGWGLTLTVAMLIQMLLYTLASTHTGIRKYTRYTVYAVVLVLVAVLIVYKQQSGLDLYPAARNLLNAPATRWIPVWGWLKGFCLAAVEGNTLMALLFLALNLLTILGLAQAIWRLPADFYEEALAKAEEVAEALDAIQQSESSTGSFIVKRKKDRSEKLRRDVIRRGQGARMFYERAISNRWRFAHLGFFTKTVETYLILAIAAALLSRFVLETRDLTLVGLGLGAFAFYRTLGNPLAQDTNMPYFRMIPEPTWKKLFWSLLGGTVNCLLDVLIAMVPAVIILRANPLTALGWVLFIASIDFYATIVGAFIDLSVPISAGKLVKQLAQILFIYFGLIPDAGLIGYGFYTKNLVPFIILAVIVNLLIGAIFLALTPLFIDPRSKTYRAPAAELAPEQLLVAKRNFSRLGFALFMILVVGTFLQILGGVIMNLVSSGQTWLIWVSMFAPLYLIAFPVGILLMRRVPAKPLPKETWSVPRLLSLFPICIFLMYCGSLIGTFLNWLLGLILPTAPVNPLDALIGLDSLFWRILVMVILAPILEEFIFRKQLIDRMHYYGEKRAVVLSALMFGLFHGNLSQGFYAFFLGLVFGYVYLRTGKLRHSIILHMVINFMGSVLAPELVKNLDLESMTAMNLAESGAAPFLAYLLVMGVLFLLGLVLLCLRRRAIHYDPAPVELPAKQGFRTACLNTGMILFFIGCLAEIVLSVVAL